MAKSLRKRLKAAEKLLDQKERDYSTILREFRETDGGVDQGEADRLRELADIIKGNRETISKAYFEKLGEVKAYEEILLPEVTIPVTSYKYGEAKKFDHADYYEIFHSNINAWANRIKISLLSVVLATKGSASSNFQISSLSLVIASCFKMVSVPATVAIAIGRVIASEVERGIRSKVDADEVSADILNDEWQTAFSNYAELDKKDRFREFISEWKAKNFVEDMHVPGDTALEYIGVDIFNAACRNFARDSLPTEKITQKRFVNVMLGQVENDDWGEDEDEAGDAELHFLVEDFNPEDLSDAKYNQPLFPNFVFFHGQLDDVSSGLLKAIKTVYGASTRVVDLPVLINITVFTDYEKIKLFYVKRKNMDIGNMNFVQGSGGWYDGYYSSFVKSGVIETVTVGDLVYDS